MKSKNWILIVIIIMSTFGAIAKDSTKEISDLKEKLKIAADKEKAGIFLKLASLSWDIDKNDTHIYSKKAYEFAKKFELKIEENVALRLMSNHYINNRLFDQGEKILNKALELAKGIKDPKYMEYTLNYFYHLYSTKKDIKKAIGIKYMLIDMFKNQNREDKITDAYHQMGNLCMGNYLNGPAIYYYMKVIDMYKRSGNIRNQFQLTNYVGRMYLSAGHVEKAKMLFDAVKAGIEKYKDTLKPDDYGFLVYRYAYSMGVYNRIIGEYSTALKFYDESEALAKKVKHDIFARNVSYSKGMTLISTGKIDRAASVLDKYYQFYKKKYKDQNDNYFPILYFYLKGKIMRIKGNFVKARQLFDRSLKLSKADNVRYVNGRINKNLGIMFLSEKKYQNADKVLNNALKSAKQQGKFFVYKDTLRVLAKLYKILGDKAKLQKINNEYTLLNNLPLELKRL